jgi:hypothetical protein
VRGLPASKRPEDLLHEAAERGRVSFATRRRRLRRGLRSVLQTAVSAGLAWYLAKLVWGHPAPLFAAIAAIIVSSTSAFIRAMRSAIVWRSSAGLPMTRRPR